MKNGFQSFVKTPFIWHAQNRVSQSERGWDGVLRQSGDWTLGGSVNSVNAILSEHTSVPASEWLASELTRVRRILFFQHKSLVDFSALVFFARVAYLCIGLAIISLQRPARCRLEISCEKQQINKPVRHQQSQYSYWLDLSNLYNLKQTKPLLYQSLHKWW